MNIQTHARTKLEVIVDQPNLSRLLEILEERGVRGYTVFSSSSGKGSRGTWVPAQLSDADDRVMLVAVMQDELAEEVMGDLAELFVELRGVAFASDVRVMRSERF